MCKLCRLFVTFFLLSGAAYHGAVGADERDIGLLEGWPFLWGMSKDEASRSGELSQINGTPTLPSIDVQGVDFAVTFEFDRKLIGHPKYPAGLNHIVFSTNKGRCLKNEYEWLKNSFESKYQVLTKDLHPDSEYASAMFKTEDGDLIILGSTCKSASKEDNRLSIAVFSPTY